MAGRKEYKQIQIDVEPFLSIMAIVLKLISLILVVIVMRIAVNPKAKKIIALSGLWEGSGNVENPKVPSYIDCRADAIVLFSYAPVVSLPTHIAFLPSAVVTLCQPPSCKNGQRSG